MIHKTSPQIPVTSWSIYPTELRLWASYLHIHESLCMYHPSMCTECKLQLVNIHVKYCNIEGDEPSNWCHFTADAIERINAYRFLKMMKTYFERSLNGSAWRNSAASLLLHLYNFIESIENAGNSVSVTAVGPGGWSRSLDTSHSSPVTQKCRQMSQIVTKCYTSTPIMWPLKCQKRQLYLHVERNTYMMLLGFGRWLDWWLVPTFSQFWLFGYIFWQIRQSRG